MEVAGLVLGAFPLIISAMEHGRTFVKVSRLHRRMREEYNNCRNDVKFYQIWYNRNLQNLLRSIVYDQEEVDKLLADPDADGWRDNKLHALLEESLHDSYPIYKNIMQRMNETMESLKKKLCVDEINIQSQLVVTQTTQRSTSPSSLSSTFSRLTVARSRLDYETFRVKFSLGDTTRKELFDELKECNTRLEKLLLLSNKAPPPQDSGPAAASKQISRLQSVFRAAHKNSTALYKAIQNSWRCSCQEHHYANLQLEHRTVADGISFRMILASSPLSTPGGPRWKQKGLSFKQMSEDCVCSKGHASPTSSQTLSGQTLRPTVSLPSSSNSGSTQTILLGTKMPRSKKVIIQAPDPDDIPLRTIPTDVPLCQLLDSPRDDSSCLGTVSHNGETYHIEPLTADREDEVTLGDSLSGTDRPTRRGRYLIALLLASSVAQLQCTPWIPQGVKNTDILFHPFLGADEGRKDSYREPFIRKGFTSHDSSQSASDNTAAWSFRLLGILLLELCFGQRLEDHPSRARYTAATTTEEKQMFDLVVAMTWAKSVEEEAGYDYAAAVDWCLMGGSKNHQAKDAWRDDVIKNVIVPLGKCQSYLEAASFPTRM